MSIREDGNLVTFICNMIRELSSTLLLSCGYFSFLYKKELILYWKHDYSIKFFFLTKALWYFMRTRDLKSEKCSLRYQIRACLRGDTTVWLQNFCFSCFKFESLGSKPWSELYGLHYSSIKTTVAYRTLVSVYIYGKAWVPNCILMADLPIVTGPLIPLVLSKRRAVDQDAILTATGRCLPLKGALACTLSAYIPNLVST